MKYLRALILIAIILPFNAWSNRDRNWSDDLDSFYHGLKTNHINPFSKISETEFRDRMSFLKQNAKNFDDTRMILELMKLTQKVGDGHTAVHFRQVIGLKKFPIEVYDDAGVWRVTGIAKEHQPLLGSQLTHIDNYRVEELKKALSEVVQFVENKHSLQRRILQYTRYSDILFGLGLIKHPERATFTFSNGTEKTVIELQSESSESDLRRHQLTKPKLVKIQDAGIDALWYGTIPDTHAVYVKFGRYPSFEQMDAFGQDLLNHINKNQVKQLILDLRGNWGGDFYVGVWLAHYLNLADSIDWLNGVYTLVDNHTFSAATINAAQFKQLLNAKVVGEPTGSNPNGVQDMDTFQLPNSGLRVSYSKRVFRLQGKPDEPLNPDVVVKHSWESYIAGEDRVLMWILNDLDKSSLH